MRKWIKGWICGVRGDRQKSPCINLSEAVQGFEINVKEILFSRHVFHKVLG